MSNTITEEDLNPTPELKLDEYGQAINCVETALWVREELLDCNPVALPLSLGDGFTMFYTSFVNLRDAIPQKCCYQDGSSRGLQINIDRMGSYAVPWGRSYHDGYISEKLKVGVGSALYLSPFFNTVLTGKNCFLGVKW